MDRMLSMPSLPLGQVDHGRRTQVDEFYLLCQMHRDQYRDRSGRLHPLDYFRSTDYKWQSPPDVTRTYLKHLPSYVKYYRPVVLAQTTARTVPPPPLPERSLAGRYYRLSDSRYKR
ncbi:ciliary microtubule inner protein 2C-like isoform X2 [Bacillus rossius redtenbacheri]